jgi:hypothetical protein
MSTLTYRGDRRREVRRRNILVRHEEERQQLARMVRRFQAIARGREIPDDEPHQIAFVAEQRRARTGTGALLLTLGCAFVVCAIAAPGAMLAAYVLGWIAALPTYLLLRPAVKRPSACAGEPRSLLIGALGDEDASTYLPLVGVLAAIAFPVATLVHAAGFGVVGAAVAVVGVMIPVYVSLRNELADERELLEAGGADS